MGGPGSGVHRRNNNRKNDAIPMTTINPTIPTMADFIQDPARLSEAPLEELFKECARAKEHVTRIEKAIAQRLYDLELQRKSNTPTCGARATTA